MNSSTPALTITVERSESGQRRRYGDSFYGAVLTFSWRPTEAIVRQIAACTLRYGGTVAKTQAEKENWASAYFEYVTPLQPGVWRVLIVEPYTD